MFRLFKLHRAQFVGGALLILAHNTNKSGFALLRGLTTLSSIN